jgi:hypothetical protein
MVNVVCVVFFFGGLNLIIIMFVVAHVLKHSLAYKCFVFQKQGGIDASISTTKPKRTLEPTFTP